MNSRATPGRQHGIELARGMFPNTKWGTVQYVCQGKLPETKFGKVVWGVVLLLATAFVTFCFAQWVSSAISLGRSVPMGNASSPEYAAAAPRLGGYIQPVGVGTYRVDSYPVTHYFRTMDGKTTLVAVQTTRENLDNVSLALLTERQQVLQNGLEANGYLYEDRSDRIVGLREQGARVCNVFASSTDYAVHCSDVPITEELLFPRVMALIGR